MSLHGNSKDLSQARFNKFAQSYVTGEALAKGEELTRLVDIVLPQAQWIVLDVACGGGHTALRFAPHVTRVIATDIAPKMLQAAEAFILDKGIKNVTFNFADAESLPFKDGAFDLVTCRIAPHHFPDCFSFIKQSVRVLKTGGTLLVQDHVLPEDEQAGRYLEKFEKLRDPSHHQAYTQIQWIKMFQAAGLKVAHTEQIIKRHGFLSWAQRQGCSPEIIEHLVSLVKKAPQTVTEWLQPHRFGTPQAVFIGHHIIITGRKG
jgi:ubiquinone/menaquinone biosynthesis C-methylase UbiE